MSGPLIFAVKRASLDDGPGIRTVAFMKGCPLRCTWCHNPESQTTGVHITLDAELCHGCGRCREACVTEAFVIETGNMRAGNQSGTGDAAMQAPPTGRPRVDAARCVRCGACVAACPFGALRMVGERYSVAALCEIALRDAAYYAASGGGVTFSGGEPLLYPQYVGQVAAWLKSSGVGVAIQTCGQFGYAAFWRHVAPHVDTIYFDIKLADSAAHARHTGRGNRRILQNLVRLVGDGLHVVPRTPCIPGITDTAENMAAIDALLARYGLRDAHVLLPFNQTRKRPRLRLL